MSDTPVFSTAAVAAPHGLAARAGQAVLAQGGNALEAMVAMAATIAVVYPHMNGIGGDGFWLVREPRGRVRGIDASGAAGGLATIRRYRERGHDRVPPRGPDAALTVAGAVSGWIAALDYARSLGGRLPLDLLLADAIGHARRGCPVSRSEARYRPKEVEALHASPGFAAAFLTEGKTPEAGATRRQPALADTLQHLADAGLDDFYRGDVAREIAADLERADAPVTRADLKACEARAREPLQARLADCTLFNMPPPSQGLASLLLLAIHERLPRGRPESLEHHHGLIEATKRAFAIRDRVVTDPRHFEARPEDQLTEAVFAREAAAIAGDRAAPFPLPRPAEGDTIWMGAVDASGLAVSYIQSLFWEFGSGLVLPATGILWQNRGAAFSLDPASRNPLEPGRKPFHTLCPALAVFDDGRVAPYGCMGGEGQPQFQAQVLSRYRFGMSLAQALDRPRWLLGRTWGRESATLKLEEGFEGAVISGLERLGHPVEPLGGAHLDALGHAGILVRHPRDGRVEAAHDPRADGGAEGL